MSAYGKKLLGQKLGKLTIIEELGRNKHGSILWKCLCECGNLCERTTSNIFKRKIPSCGTRYCKHHYQGNLEDATTTIVYHNYLQSCKKSKREFLLTKTDFSNLIFKNCTYCGSPPTTTFKKKRGNYIEYNGLDRIDNSKGYTLNNVVTCCFICNRAKWNFSIQEWKAWLKSVIIFNRDLA